MGNVEIPVWLKALPLAPVFRPTDTEFADPIAYISKIEKEASAFGICKIIPPLPKPSKKFVFNNLNNSLFNEACNTANKDSGDAVFTTRQQELGFDSKKSKASVESSQKQVWQSGEFYTLQQFESKSKVFSRTVLSPIKDVTPLVIETLFWKASKEKPIYVEYANDVPGSGFGEPEGLLRYFCARKRRRRVCGQGHGGNSYSYWGREGGNDVRNLHNDVQELASASNSSSFAELGKEFMDPQTSATDESSQSNRQRGVCANSELEGTAGWKLSNCPWNLQVIARSAGSLTRYMLDDIPGVTSPMVYIGMLFSWFAWHVEDHELHSLNFLHTGSPKTWYAVPGEYAFAFEDVVCKQAYGGDVEHLAALKILGEKTTLLSPEIVVASGIPCCRLIQNPGEFVVTFPRAYHIGFSHGFNCGEAANFGTPQWLSIAKDAAVRRAVMDHLPMLSHQQLLYLLTMSFISRIPRSLLPGVRSSRLKNRLKEERELLVKKAFIEDMLKENRLLNILLQKDSAFRAVLWHPDSLPSLSRDSTTVTSPELSIFPKEGLNQERQVSYEKPFNDSYLESSDMSCDFQIDSGALVCVACGILGYPIMSVVQPSKKASVVNFPAESISVTGAIDISEQLDSETNNGEKWDTSEFLRPRIFCLEHALKVEELLRAKGGVKMLVICHSDYQKIKANATVIAEELRSSFNYEEVQFDSASLEELKLIDTATDNEQLTDLHEDWTSKLGINLRFSVKTKKDNLPKKIGHALNVDYLLSIMAPASRISRIKWCSRKSRTKGKPNHKTIAKRRDANISQKDKLLHVSSSMDIEPKVLLQYHRRKFRANSINSARDPIGSKMVITEALMSTSHDFNLLRTPLVREESDKGNEFFDSDNGSIKENECLDSENPSSEKYKAIYIGRENEIAVVASDLVNVEMGGGDVKVRDNICASFKGPENLATCAELSTTMLVDDVPVVSTDGLHDSWQAGVSAASMSDEPEEKGKKSNIAKMTCASVGEQKRKFEKQSEASNTFIRSPCEGLRPRKNKEGSVNTQESEKPEVKSLTKKLKKSSGNSVSCNHMIDNGTSYQCNVEGCRMRFMTKTQLSLHKNNKCHHKNCGKRFQSHKYVLLHQRVHDDKRPLRCTWKGCTMTFKWAWARTEHLRLHTGERPYECKIKGCGLTFRFVSDFSRHRRKTGHVNPPPNSGVF